MDYNVFQNNNTLKNVNKNYKWELYKLTDILEDDTKNAKKIKKEQYLKEGKYPIIDQGQSEIAGYTNDKEGIYKQEYPFLIFGDHTRSIKYIDDSIFIGADGVKLLKPRLDIKKFNVRYVYYFLKTVQLPSDGYSRHFKYLKQVVIALPLLEQQNKIVEVLDKSQKLINKRKAQIEALDELVKSRFIEMFGDPVLEEKFKKVNIDDIKANEKFSIVDGPFGASLKNGDYVDSGIPIIRINNIKPYEYYDGEYKYITIEKYEELIRSKVEKGDILMARVGNTIGKSCIFNKEFKALLSTTGVCKIKCDKKIANNTFIVQQLNMPIYREYIWRNIKGSGQPCLNLTTIKGLKVILPPIELQNQFASFVKQVDKLKFEMQESLKELEDNFNSLMQRAFKGELFN